MRKQVRVDDVDDVAATSSAHASAASSRAALLLALALTVALLACALPYVGIQSMRADDASPTVAPSPSATLAP